MLVVLAKWQYDLPFFSGCQSYNFFFHLLKSLKQWVNDCNCCLLDSIVMHGFQDFYICLFLSLHSDYWLFQFVFCPYYTVVLFGSLCWKLRIRCSEIILDVPKLMVLQLWCIVLLYFKCTGTGLDCCFYATREEKRILTVAHRYWMLLLCKHPILVMGKGVN